MGAFEEMERAADDLAAGDEVEAVERVLQTISGQLDAMAPGGGNAPSAEKPTAHVSVPSDGIQTVPLPAGQTDIDFADGRVMNDDLGTVIDDLTRIVDLSSQFERETAALESLVFVADTQGTVAVGNNRGQSFPLSSVPIPSKPFNSASINLDYPGNVYVLASTKPLDLSVNPRGLFASRIGTTSGALNGWTSVPLTPHGLYEQAQADPSVADPNAYGDASLWAAGYPSTSFAIDNVGANDLEVRIQGKGPDTPGGSASWRTLGSTEVVTPGASTFINVTDNQRHELLRAQVQNTAKDDGISTAVEVTEASP